MSQTLYNKRSLTKHLLFFFPILEPLRIHDHCKATKKNTTTLDSSYNNTVAKNTCTYIHKQVQSYRYFSSYYVWSFVIEKYCQSWQVIPTLCNGKFLHLDPSLYLTIIGLCCTKFRSHHN